jgi:hypothetical protein
MKKTLFWICFATWIIGLVGGIVVAVAWKEPMLGSLIAVAGLMPVKLLDISTR